MSQRFYLNGSLHSSFDHPPMKNKMDSALFINLIGWNQPGKNDKRKSED